MYLRFSIASTSCLKHMTYDYNAVDFINNFITELH